MVEIEALVLELFPFEQSQSKKFRRTVQESKNVNLMHLAETVVAQTFKKVDTPVALGKQLFKTCSPLRHPDPMCVVSLSNHCRVIGV